jgi:hypothetical protein
MKKIIKSTFEKMKSRKWNKIYFAIDVHDTILPSNYDNKIIENFYPFAKQTLQYLSKRDDCVLIMYSSMHSEGICKHLQFFKEHEIYFYYVNQNPEIKNTEYANFNNKFYFNILIDDKAGFEAEWQWKEIYSEMLQHEVILQEKDD